MAKLSSLESLLANWDLKIDTERKRETKKCNWKANLYLLDTLYNLRNPASTKGIKTQKSVLSLCKTSTPNTEKNTIPPCDARSKQKLMSAIENEPKYLTASSTYSLKLLLALEIPFNGIFNCIV
ncbi:hypothetical protein WICPIJ_007314 [Wickerhamomyces pijperi]|uniref:Uncharacterized protein n=1 Tax=Wickerhamomyces pijperi TaxID=599730 RepID=A0A9P8Q0R6_WICPI|nr:hypothetical protein WICPIJ_007314 [Wickerhamomyces pijperi]